MQKSTSRELLINYQLFPSVKVIMLLYGASCNELGYLKASWAACSKQTD